MEIAAIPPTTPPAMAPGFELLPPEPDEDPVIVGVRVVMVVDTVMPLGPKKYQDRTQVCLCQTLVSS